MTLGFNQEKSQMLFVGTPREVVFHISETIAGIDLKQFESGSAAIKSSDLKNCDLILVDQKIEDMTGVEFVETLLLRNVSAPLLFMAARGQEDAAARAIDLGASHYVIKDPVGNYFKIVDAILKKYLKFPSALDNETGDTECRDAFQTETSEPLPSIPEDEPRPELKPSQKELSILMAEDNPFNKKVAISILEMRGHSVRVVDNGKKAVNAYQKGGYDLILMDIQMPEMDGLEATRRIRSLEKGKESHIPIIAVTAFGADTDRESCLQAGMDEYLQKPYKPSELFKAIEAVIDKNGPEAKVADDAGDSGDDVFSMKTILAIAGGREQLVKELIKLFFDNIEGPLNALREGVASKNGNQIRFGAHSLKGMSLNLSAKRVAQAALELEEIGKHGLFDEADEKLKELEAEIERLRSAVLPFGGSI